MSEVPKCLHYWCLLLYTNICLNAIIINPKLTYGLNRSPILANFQNTPKSPVLLRSNTLGQVACTYVHVQINNNITCKRELKLNNADYNVSNNQTMISLRPGESADDQQMINRLSTDQGERMIEPHPS